MWLVKLSPKWSIMCRVELKLYYAIPSGIASRQRLRCSSLHHLVVPRHRRSTLGCRAFSVAGPMTWNALPDDFWDPSLSANNFRKKLKTHLFRCTWTLSALEALHNALCTCKAYLLTCHCHLPALSCVVLLVSFVFVGNWLNFNMMKAPSRGSGVWTTCPRLLSSSIANRIRTYNLLIASPTPYC